MRHKVVVHKEIFRRVAI